MPFTDPWSDVIPDNSTLAELIGADIRQLRLDIHERMNVAFVDWTADPLVFQPVVLGSKNGIIVPVPFSAIVNAAAYDGVSGFATLGAGVDYIIPIRVPYGCTITSFQISAAGSGTLTVSLYKRFFNHGGAASIDILDCACVLAAGQAIFSSSVIAELMNGAYYYWLRLSLVGGGGGGCAFFGANIDINRPSNDFST